MRIRTKGAVVALGGALLATALLASGASAGAVPLQVTFRVTESSCVEGTSNKVGLTVQLRSSSGAVLDTDAATHGPDESFEACFNRLIKSGNRLRAIFGDTSRSFTIPVLTVKPNRVSNIVSGTGPKGKTLKVRLYDCAWMASPECVRKTTRTITVDGNGNWRRDFSSVFDARGYDQARVTYESSAGHTFMVQRAFPWMRASLDHFNGFDHPNNLLGASYSGLTRTFKLRATPGGTVLATRTAQGDSVNARFALYFGRAIEPGNQVTATFADDGKLTVWPVEMSVTYKDGDQFINGWCLPSRKVGINWYDGQRSVQADSQGKAFVNLRLAQGPGYSLLENHLISVSCQNSKGDVVTRWFRHHYSPED